MARQPLTDITPAAESGAMDTSPDIMPASESERKKPAQSWDSLCVSKDCPIKHPHNYGLRPEMFPAPITIWQDADAFTADDDCGNFDIQPPPLIKAIVDTLRIDPKIMTRYPRFTDVLRDFYRAHGGCSDKYHGPGGMFGLGMDRRGELGYDFRLYHKHPDVAGMGGWFEFEVERNDTVATSRY